MRLLVLSMLALVAGADRCAPASAAAQEQSQKPAEADPIQEAISAYYDHLFARRFDHALAAAAKLEANDLNDEGRALAGSMQAAALLGLDRDSDAQARIAEVTKLAPRDHLPFSTLFVGAILADKTNAAADAFDILIARFPDIAREQEPEMVFHLLRNAPKDQERRNQDRKVTLARIGYGGDLKGDYLAEEAVGILLERGDAGQATELLRYIDEPQPFENMLVMKRYSALWPALEERAGENLEKVRASNVATAERAYAQAPEDPEILQLLADALRQAGRHEEAIALRTKLPATSAAMAQANEQTGWAVNNIALALHEAGRNEEADALFAMLNEAPMPPGQGRWRVSMIINRLEVLVRHGKFDKALALLNATELSARNDGNAYAQQLVRRLKYCTFSGLGRKDEAAKLLPEVLAHAKDARRATVDGLLCAGETEKAEQLILDGLKESDAENFAEELVRSLQPVALTSDDPSVWQASWTELRKQPAIAREYNRLGRDMPERFLPMPTKATAHK